MVLRHSSDIDSNDFIKIYKIDTAEPYYFLVNDATLASNNPLRFPKNLFKIMTIDDHIRDEKLQYDSNRKASEISALLLGRIDKY